MAEDDGDQLERQIFELETELANARRELQDVQKETNELDSEKETLFVEQYGLAVFLLKSGLSLFAVHEDRTTRCEPASAPLQVAPVVANRQQQLCQILSQCKIELESCKNDLSWAHVNLDAARNELKHTTRSIARMRAELSKVEKSADDAGEDLCLCVSLLSGEGAAMLMLPASATLWDVHEQLEKVTGVLFWHQRLVVGVREFAPNASLDEVGLGKGGQITLIKHDGSIVQRIRTSIEEAEPYAAAIISRQEALKDESVRIDAELEIARQSNTRLRAHATSLGACPNSRCILRRHSLDSPRDRLFFFESLGSHNEWDELLQELAGAHAEVNRLRREMQEVEQKNEIARRTLKFILQDNSDLGCSIVKALFGKFDYTRDGTFARREIVDVLNSIQDKATWEGKKSNKLFNAIASSNSVVKYSDWIDWIFGVHAD